MRLLSVLLLVLVLGESAFPAEPEFPLTEDSKPHADIPHGELIKGTYTAKDGSVFPGTERDYTIYRPPVALGPTLNAPFMIFQDGVIYNAPTVFDNLIAKKQIPPLIGIFIKPGVVPAATPNALPRYNRSYEYDSITDTYSRFLLDEFLPAIEQKHGIKLSSDPNDAAIAGNSSGGICAFMAAWHRPDRIRRVFSGVGTYVGIHGADQLPVLVRKYEPKPLRIWLQSGTGDNNLYCGDWWMANQTMERALTWAGYDVNHTWGEGGHNAKHASQIFPDVLRWLWRDYATAKEIKPNPRGESKWRGYEVIGDGKWEECWTNPNGSKEHEGIEHICSDKDGKVFGSLWSNDSRGVLQVEPKIGPNGFRKLKNDGPIGLALAPDGSLYVGTSNHRIIRMAHDQQESLFSENEPWKGAAIFAVTNSGNVVQYHFANGGGGSIISVIDSKDGKERSTNLGGGPVITMTEADGKERRLPWLEPKINTVTGYVNGMTLSPDQTSVYITDSAQRNVMVGQIGADYFVRHFQEYCHLEISDSLLETGAFASGLCVDTNGWLYVATALGIQVCDQAGRVNFIIPTPQPPHDVCFGGKDLGELFIACGDKIYKRPTKAHGIVSGQMAPIKPPAPKL